MRCHYWVWKNTRIYDDEMVGFHHYRRHYDWNGLEPASLDIITPTVFMLGCTLAHNYRGSHTPAHWDVLNEVLYTHGYSESDLNVYMLSPCNIFIMRGWLFKQYMKHWWDIVTAVESRIDIVPDGYQHRALGFLSERIFTLWLNRTLAATPAVRHRTVNLILS